MISEEDVINYRKMVLMQLDALESINTDGYEDENAVEHRLLISHLDGKLKAYSRVLNMPESPVKNIIFTMYGASDDLIELEGDIDEEIGAFDVVRKFVMSEGTSGTIEYTEDGVWRINILKTGSAVVVIDHPTNEEIEEDTNYTDKALVSGKIEWIVFDDGTLVYPNR